MCVNNSNEIFLLLLIINFIIFNKCLNIHFSSFVVVKLLWDITPKLFKNAHIFLENIGVIVTKIGISKLNILFVFFVWQSSTMIWLEKKDTPKLIRFKHLLYSSFLWNILKQVDFIF